MIPGHVAEAVGRLHGSHWTMREIYDWLRKRGVRVTYKEIQACVVATELPNAKANLAREIMEAKVWWGHAPPFKPGPLEW